MRPFHQDWRERSIAVCEDLKSDYMRSYRLLVGLLLGPQSPVLPRISRIGRSF
jgi:hypothetical protein